MCCVGNDSAIHTTVPRMVQRALHMLYYNAGRKIEILLSHDDQSRCDNLFEIGDWVIVELQNAIQSQNGEGSCRSAGSISRKPPHGIRPESAHHGIEALPAESCSWHRKLLPLDGDRVRDLYVTGQVVPRREIVRCP